SSKKKSTSTASKTSKKKTTVSAALSKINKKQQKVKLLQEKIMKQQLEQDLQVKQSHATTAEQCRLTPTVCDRHLSDIHDSIDSVQRLLDDPNEQPRPGQP